MSLQKQISKITEHRNEMEKLLDSYDDMGIENTIREVIEAQDQLIDALVEDLEDALDEDRE